MSPFQSNHLPGQVLTQAEIADYQDCSASQAYDMALQREAYSQRQLYHQRINDDFGLSSYTTRRPSREKTAIETLQDEVDEWLSDIEITIK